MWLLFLPILVLIGLMFALGGIFWVLGTAWPVLLICLGAWLLLHGDGGHRQRRRRPAPVVAPRAVHDAKRQPRGLSSMELPIDVQVKVEQIRRKVDVLLGFADRFPPYSKDLYLVRETAAEYLPRTLDAFVRLPKEAIDRPVVAGGKTAREELKSQLDLLDSKLDDIAQDLQRQDADRLLANRRFLEARFGNVNPQSGAA